METLQSLVDKSLDRIQTLMPWDLAEKLENEPDSVILDVREADEFAAMHIPGSINVPRGILEASCEYGYAETIPELVEARDRPVVVVCRSGNRSALAAEVLSLLGYRKPYSLNTGVRGWNDYDQPLVNASGETVDPDEAEAFLNPPVSEAQRGLQKR